MRFLAKLSDFIDLVYVQAIMSEPLKIVAISKKKDPANSSCCAEQEIEQSFTPCRRRSGSA